MVLQRALRREVGDRQGLPVRMPKKPSIWFSHDALVGV